MRYPWAFSKKRKGADSTHVSYPSSGLSRWRKLEIWGRGRHNFIFVINRVLQAKFKFKTVSVVPSDERFFRRPENTRQNSSILLIERFWDNLVNEENSVYSFYGTRLRTQNLRVYRKDENSSKKFLFKCDFIHIKNSWMFLQIYILASYLTEIAKTGCVIPET